MTAPRIRPGDPRRIRHQSNPGVRRRRVSQPSIHLPRSVYLPSMKMGAAGLRRLSLGAKNSSLATSTAPPRRSDARSISSMKSIGALRLAALREMGFTPSRKSRKNSGALAQEHSTLRPGKLAAIINDLAAKKSLFYFTAQDLAIIGRYLVAMMNH